MGDLTWIVSIGCLCVYRLDSDLQLLSRKKKILVWTAFFITPVNKFKPHTASSFSIGKLTLNNEIYVILSTCQLVWRLWIKITYAQLTDAQMCS